MIWIFTHPEPLANEAQHLNALLDAGAETVVLRKPGWIKEQYVQLLEQLDGKHYARMMIAGLPEVASSFGLKGVHMSELKRQALPGNQQLPHYLHCSAAIHTTDAINILGNDWDTLVLSPVFDSISKKGYQAAFDSGLKIAECSCNVLALGGINEDTAGKVRRMGFDGVVVMGALWQDPAGSARRFERIQQAWNNM